MSSIGQPVLRGSLREACRVLGDRRSMVCGRREKRRVFFGAGVYGKLQWMARQSFGYIQPVLRRVGRFLSNPLCNSTVDFPHPPPFALKTCNGLCRFGLYSSLSTSALYRQASERAFGGSFYRMEARCFHGQQRALRILWPLCRRPRRTPTSKTVNRPAVLI